MGVNSQEEGICYRLKYVAALIFMLWYLKVYTKKLGNTLQHINQNEWLD